jgi:hypothetical protein
MIVMRSLLLATCAALVASLAAAQGIPNVAAPKAAAQRAVAAENAQLSAQTGQQIPLKSGPATAATTPATAAPAPVPGANGTTVVGVAPKASRTLAKIPPVTREVFNYDGAGRRDPFYSLILTDDLRPLLSDLKLVGVLWSPAGGRSVAIFRDIQTNAQYRVQPGAALGRMRVAEIKPKGVIFTIDEFGLSRQDSLMMTDTTKVRIR